MEKGILIVMKRFRMIVPIMNIEKNPTIIYSSSLFMLKFMPDNSNSLDRVIAMFLDTNLSKFISIISH